MTNAQKNVRNLSRKEYADARRKAVRDEPREEMAPSERPLPSDAMAMTRDQYAAAKRKATRS
jgi:hypothetical protein